MPALAAAYATGATGYGLRAAADEIVMMLPVLRSFMRGRKLLMVRKVAVRLPSIDACHSSSLICSNWAGSGEAAAGIGDENVDRPEFPFNPPANGFDIA